MSDQDIFRSTRRDAGGRPLGVSMDDPEPVKDWISTILKNTADRILEDDELPPHITPGSMAASVWRFARLVELTSALAKCWMQVSQVASAEYARTQAHAERGHQEDGQAADEGGPGR